MPRRLTTEEFIEKARAVHGNRYDYSMVKYVGAHSKVTIICRDHGAFEQTPANHRSGKGCDECGKLTGAEARRKTTDQFIAKAMAVHGDRYDYSKVRYVEARSKVTIFCRDHGFFEQLPDSHIRGSGCDDCGRLVGTEARRKTTDQFIANAKAVHGDCYDYSLVEYVDNVTKVLIICRDHGTFEQSPSAHLNGSGCYECGKLSSAEAKRKTADQFITNAKAVHGDRYDYSLVEYLAAIKTVTIICPDHDAFEQTGDSHLSGTGCPDCAESGFNPSEPGILYYVAVTTDDGDTRYKIGITNLTVKRRFPAADLARIRIVKTWQFAVGRVAEEREAEILYQYAGDRYYGPDILVGAGNTELFTHDVLGLDKQDDEHGQTVVDEDASLISRPIQSDLDF